MQKNNRNLYIFALNIELIFFRPFSLSLHSTLCRLGAAWIGFNHIAACLPSRASLTQHTGAWQGKCGRFKGHGVTTATTNRSATPIVGSQRATIAIFACAGDPWCGGGCRRWTIAATAGARTSARIKTTASASAQRTSRSAEIIQCYAE